MTTERARSSQELPRYDRFVWTAFAAILALVLSIGGWAMFARLDSAVVTQGAVLAESERKTVQHLEGGILEALLVRPGQRVDEGEIVARLDATQTTELLAQLGREYEATSFEHWRLEAERRNAERLDPTTAPASPEVIGVTLARNQIELFAARRSAFEGRVASLLEQIEQLKAEIEANAGQARAAERQRELLIEERDMIARLVKKGAAPRIKVLELERRIADQEGERDENSNLVAAARTRIKQARIEIENTTQERRLEIAEGLERTQRQMLDLESRMRSADDVLERHLLRSPQDGVVVDIRLVTPGGVLAPAEPLMDIVPLHDRLVVQTRLPPEAIDTVHVGRTARVRLTAYKRSEAPTVDGEVAYVSADLLEDERDGSAYFEARVVLDAEAVLNLANAQIVSGMPVEVMIKTGTRRAGDYFLEPLLRHMRRAMVEE